MRLAFAIFALLLCGCSAPKAIPEKEPIILLWSANTIDMTSAKAWAKEAETRLHTRDFVLLCVHGGPKDGAWVCSPDAPRKSMKVDDVAWVMRNIWWDKPLVIISCNAGGSELTTPRTLYGRRVIWACPDSASPLWPFRDHALIGRIEDFTWSEKVKLAGER